MRRWEFEQQQKNHLLKICNAKATLESRKGERRGSTFKTRKKVRSGLSGLAEPFARNPREQRMCPNLLRIFQICNMEQYVRPLLEQGFGSNVRHFNQATGDELNSLLNKIGVKAEHKARMLSLINYIKLVASQALGEGYFESKTFGLPKERSRDIKSQLQKRTKPFAARKLTDHPRHLRTKQFNWSGDDSTITHDVREGKIAAKHNSGLAARLNARLKPGQTSEGLLGYRAARQLFQSMEGGKICSTIINLDLEDLASSYAALLVQLLQLYQVVASSSQLFLYFYESHADSEAVQKSPPPRKLEVRTPLQAPKTAELVTVKKAKREEQREDSEQVIQYCSSLNQQDDKEGEENLSSHCEEIAALVRESLVNEKLQQSSNDFLRRAEEEGLLPTEEVLSEEQETVLEESVCAQDLQQLQRVSYFGQVYGNKQHLSRPDQTAVKNFVVNLVTTAKIEKQAVIIAVVYLRRLLQGSGCRLGPRTWRSVTLASVLLGSKIWDDDSYENDSISQMFSDYSTVELNRLERVFLQFVDYKLGVSPREYSDAYFLLRRFAKSSQRSYSLRPLDLLTILRLQRSEAKGVGQNKQKHRSKPDKSI